MKNLNEMLQLATKLNKQDMKTISGGAVSSNCCAYNSHWSSPSFTCLTMGGSPALAESLAGEDGWWACNSAEVIAACGSVCSH